MCVFVCVTCAWLTVFPNHTTLHVSTTFTHWRKCLYPSVKMSGVNDGFLHCITFVRLYYWITLYCIDTNVYCICMRCLVVYLDTYEITWEMHTLNILFCKQSHHTESLQRPFSFESTFPYQVFGQFRLHVCLGWDRFWFSTVLDTPPSISQIRELIFILTNM